VGDKYDWGLLSGSAGLIYGYTGIVPIGLFFVLKWFGSESANLLECWCLYGYSNIIWIPVALISWSPITGKFDLLFKRKANYQFLTMSSWLRVLQSLPSSSYETCTQYLPQQTSRLARFSSLWSSYCKRVSLLQSRFYSLRMEVQLSISLMFPMTRFPNHLQLNSQEATHLGFWLCLDSFLYTMRSMYDFVPESVNLKPNVNVKSPYQTS
jgi:hypothetical protein